MKVSADELDVQGINGSRVLRLDKDGNVFVAADTVVHVDSPSIGEKGKARSESLTRFSSSEITYGFFRRRTLISRKTTARSEARS